ncbi:hypothetical protein K443DRAFT_131714 [Laccaria amethystina LaAM-08-1]|uniref:Mitochondrial carrier n=1 Tax=Laccaria amethystina LaAM-08-1 TaxID=1095629 RepID=A0A0C9XYR3_9AGAR|nr:hypothetical protein K443DRAFT_131714 [Laccaria amethystina LaAM-08-1]
MPARVAAKEIAFGSLAGMVSEILEYPFDLAKVRLQAQLIVPGPTNNALRFDGPLDCLMQTWRDEGVRGLYRGLPAPIVGSMAETAAIFLSYSAFQNLIRSVSSSSNTHLDRSTPLSIAQLGLAAAGAGFVTSFIITPIELVKCKMQVQMMNPVHAHPSTQSAPGRIPHRPMPIITSDGRIHSSPTTSRSNASHRLIHDVAYKSATLPTQTINPPGPVSLIRSIVDTHGIRGLWLGHTGTLLRETGGSAAWFIVKEWVARRLVANRIPKDTLAHHSPKLLPWESAFSGAVAGAVGALILYPADTVKSAIQTEEELRPRAVMKPGSAASQSSRRLPSTFMGTLRRMYSVYGLRGLYAGCGMTVARAVPSSGIIFLVYDGLNAWFA